MFRHGRVAVSFVMPFVAVMLLAGCGGGASLLPHAAADPGLGTTTSSAAFRPATDATGSNVGHLSASVPGRITVGSNSGLPLQAASASDAFVDSIGINVHLHDTNTPYVTGYAAVRSFLVGSGIRHIRDGLIDTTWKTYYQHLTDLSSAGIHADLITNVAESAALIAAYPARVPGAIEAIEAPNEYNVSGAASAASLGAFQTSLYAAVRGNAATAAFPVIGPSLIWASQYGQVGNLSSALDFGNMHDYFSGRNPGTAGWGGTDAFGTYGSLAWNIAIARQADPAKPIVATETGYNDAPTSQNPVPAAIKARYTVRTLLEHWNAGVRRTYLYQLLDDGTSSETYGLIDNALNPKPAYSALVTFIAHLADPGPAYAAAPLALKIDAATPVHHLLLARRDGSYALVLWVEAPAYDVNAKAPVAVASQPVTLHLARPPSGMTAGTIGDAGGFSPVAVAAAGDGTARLQIDDHVTILDIRP